MAQPDPLTDKRIGPVLVPLRADLSAEMRPADSFVIQDAEVTAQELYSALEEGGDLHARLGLPIDAQIAEAVKKYPNGVRRWIRASVIADRLCVRVQGAMVANVAEDWTPDLSFWSRVMRDNTALEILFALLSTDLRAEIDAGNALGPLPAG